MRFEDTPADLRPLYDEHAVIVVPVFEGSGTRGKILEALSYERAVVTTTKGPEGLDLQAGEGFVIADEPGEFANAIQKLFDDPESPVGNRSPRARSGSEPDD